MAGRMLTVFGVIMIIHTMLRKSSAGRNAFSKDIQGCMLDSWTTANVLASNPTCTGSQKPLCYSVSGSKPAQFITCYNTGTLIPDYAANMLVPVTSDGKGRPSSSAWKTDKGSNAPSPESDVSTDYAKASQAGLYPNFGDKNNSFLARGHYVGSDGFATKAERTLTFINTNIAPQWQDNNGGNWCKLEQVIVDYVNGLTTGTKAVYIFTGTAGQAKDGSGQPLKLNSKVTVPQYYWKAVCHPGVGSVLFYAINNVGDIKTTKSNGCNSMSQTSKFGIIQCLSMTQAASQQPTSTFKLPSFNATTCTTGTRGTFLDTALNGKLQ